MRNEQEREINVYFIYHRYISADPRNPLAALLLAAHEISSIIIQEFFVSQKVKPILDFYGIIKQDEADMKHQPDGIVMSFKVLLYNIYLPIFMSLGEKFGAIYLPLFKNYPNKEEIEFDRDWAIKAARNKALQIKIDKGREDILKQAQDEERSEVTIAKSEHIIGAYNPPKGE